MAAAAPLPGTAEALLAGLPSERAAALRHVRELVNAALPPGYEEGVAGKLITWSIPLSRFPKTYNKQPLQLAALGAQKSHNALYLMGLYLSEDRSGRFEQAFAAAGKSLDKGKSCVRFRDPNDLDDAAITDAIASLPVDTYIAEYEASRR